jgi:hyperosmotically inducible protein
MNKRLRTIGLFLSLLVSAGVAQAAERKDIAIAQEIAAAVNDYSQFTIFDDVSVSVDNGVVTLDGKVTMPYKRNEIEKIADEIDGVRETNNRIAVLPASKADDDLRFQLARSIYGNSNFWDYAAMRNPPIHIIVDHGRVTLTGVVRSEVDRMLARSLATQFGVFSVTNKLETNQDGRRAQTRE